MVGPVVRAWSLQIGVPQLQVLQTSSTPPPCQPPPHHPLSPSLVTQSSVTQQGTGALVLRRDQEGKMGRPRPPKQKWGDTGGGAWACLCPRWPQQPWEKGAWVGEARRGPAQDGTEVLHITLSFSVPSVQPPGPRAEVRGPCQTPGCVHPSTVRAAAVGAKDASGS